MQAPRWTEILDAAHGRSCVASDVAPSLDEWRDRVDPRDPTSLVRRLAWAGLDAECARWALMQVDGIATDDRWRAELVEYLAGMHPTHPTDDVIAQTFGEPGLVVPFVHVLHPAVLTAWARSRAEADPHELDLWSAAAQQQLRCAVLARVGYVMERALFDAFIDSGLRYHEFCARLRREEFAGFFAHFPVAARLFSTALTNAVAAAGELVRRLQRDREVLQSDLGVPSDHVVTSIDVGLSDPHDGGRQVAILTVGETRLVYKPKDVRLEFAYQDLVRQLARHGLSLRALTVVPREDGRHYGWVEHLPWRPATDAQLSTFFHRAGQLIALLYLLGCTDGHSENLIAHGDDFVLVDAETLFEARLYAPDEERYGANDVSDEAWSVLRMLIVPGWQWREARGGVIDVSALGSPPAAGRQARSGGWVDVNTDRMRWGAVDVPLRTVTSLPFDEPKTVDAQALAEGLQQAGTQLSKPSVQAVLRDHLTTMRGLDRRVVFRATAVYFGLLRNATSGEALRSPQARGLVLEQLARVFAMSDEKPVTWPLLDAELRSMEELDIPLFKQELGTTRMDIDGGSVPIRDGLEAALYRVAHVDADTFAQQAHLIRLAIGTKTRRFSMTPGARIAMRSRPPDDVAEEIVRRLVSQAQFVGHERSSSSATSPSWVIPTLLSDGEHFSLARSSLDLFDGACGVAAVLATARRVMTDSTIRAQCDELLTALLADWLGAASDPPKGVLRRPRLGLAGVGGALRALSWLRAEGALRPEDESVLTAAWLARLTPEHIATTRYSGIVFGVEGLVDPLRERAAMDPHARALLAASERRLLEGATQQPSRTMAWPLLTDAVSSEASERALEVDDDTLWTGLAGWAVAWSVQGAGDGDPERRRRAERCLAAVGAQPGDGSPASASLMTGHGGVALALMCREDPARLLALLT